MWSYTGILDGSNHVTGKGKNTLPLFPRYVGGSKTQQLQSVSPMLQTQGSASFPLRL